MKRISKLLCTTAIVSSVAFGASAEELPNYKEETLTGNWGGTRDKLAEHGVTTDILYKFDVMGNTTGGKKEGIRARDNLDVAISFDGEKLINSKGTSALIHITNNNGSQPDADLVGSSQGVNNYETTKSTTKLYQAWVQHNFIDDKVSIRGGVFDVNTEFYLTDSAGLFMNSAFGVGTDFSQSGVNGPSIFPETSAGARLKLQPTNDFYVMTAVMDGVSGDPANQYGTHVDFDSNDGALMVAEAGYTPESQPGDKIALGGWRYTEKSDDLVTKDGAGNPLRTNNDGMYIVAERKLYSEEGSKDQGLSGFVHFGFANKDVNQFDYTWSSGLVYTGFIPGRDEGQLGFGVTGAHNSKKYKEATLANGSVADSSETTLELTYSDNINKWLSVQPDIQYVINPGTDKTIDNALVIGSRFTVKF